MPPYFVKTNMNETNMRTIDVIAEGHKTVILKCFAEGMPKPTVAWYKVYVYLQLFSFNKIRCVYFMLNIFQDNVLLKENDQYFFKYNYQELNIKYLKQHDSGKYSCRAISRLGINETYQNITVKNAKCKFYMQTLYL